MIWEVCLSTLSDPFAIHLRCEACRTAAALRIQEAWRIRQGNLIIILNEYPICLARTPYIPFDIGILTGGSRSS